MKKLLLLCVLSVACSTLFAQATDLVVDCQTPGWLSSKINYGDQLTVKNLKVTGYINETDLEFIGTLLSMNLNGIIDLADATIIGNSWDGKFINIESSQNYTIQKLILPKSLTSYKESYSQTIIDSLVFDTQINKIKRNDFQRLRLNHLILGEKVDSVMEYAFYNRRMLSVHLSSSLKFIGDFAFEDAIEDLSQTNIAVFPKLESIGYLAFVNGTWSSGAERNRSTLPDTLRLPAIHEFHISSFDFKEGMHVFLGEQVEKVYYDPKVAYSNRWYPSLKNVTFHIASTTPPSTRWTPSWNDGLTVYVPKEAIDTYREHGGWKNANILAEPKPLLQIVIDKHEVAIDANENIQLYASLIPANADDTIILWESDNKNVATVSDAGLVTAVASGTANVIAMSSDGSIRDTCKVTVKAHAESISLSPSNIQLANIGDTYQLTVSVLPDNAVDKSVTWKSSNETICIVNASGLVTATGAGSTIITVTTVDGGHSATCVVKVIQHVDGLNLNKTSLPLKVGESEKLQATISPSNADNKKVIWSSADEKIASVDAEGNVTALKAGEVIVTATSEDNTEAKATCKVIVVHPVTGITLSETSYKMETIGESVQLTATVLPEDASNKNVIWSSSAESVCVVSNGNVIAVGYGTSVIIAKSEDGGFLASCIITVENTSGITELHMGDTETAPTYDVIGRRISSIRKGQLYIRNGKKVIVQ